MPKFLIRWNAGYGDNIEVIEAENKEKADRYAYDQWNQQVQDESDYESKEIPDNVVDCDGIEWSPPNLVDSDGKPVFID